MKQTRRLILCMAVVFLVFTGCASLPEPESPNDTLVIIPIGTDRDTSFTWFGKVTIEIARDGETSTIKSLTLTPGSSYRTITGLEPGRYVIHKQVFTYDSGKRGNTSHPSVKFTLAPGTLTVLDYQFRYRISRKGTEQSFTINYGFERFIGPERTEFTDRIMAMDGFEMWSSPY